MNFSVFQKSDDNPQSFGSGRTWCSFMYSRGFTSSIITGGLNKRENYFVVYMCTFEVMREQQQSVYNNNIKSAAMFSRSPVVFALFLLVAVSAVNAVPENEVLVLLDSLAVRETHSIFFKSLNGEL